MTALLHCIKRFCNVLSCNIVSTCCRLHTKNTVHLWWAVFFALCRSIWTKYHRLMRPTSGARWELCPAAAGGRIRRGAISAAVEKCKEMRKPAAFFAYRKAARSDKYGARVTGEKRLSPFREFESFPRNHQTLRLRSGSFLFTKSTESGIGFSAFFISSHFLVKNASTRARESLLL